MTNNNKNEQKTREEILKLVQDLSGLPLSMSFTDYVTNSDNKNDKELVKIAEKFKKIALDPTRLITPDVKGVMKEILESEDANLYSNSPKFSTRLVDDRPKLILDNDSESKKIMKSDYVLDESHAVCDMPIYDPHDVSRLIIHPQPLTIPIDKGIVIKFGPEDVVTPRPERDIQDGHIEFKVLKNRNPGLCSTPRMLMFNNPDDIKTDSTHLDSEADIEISPTDSKLAYTTSPNINEEYKARKKQFLDSIFGTTEMDSPRHSDAIITAQRKHTPNGNPMTRALDRLYNERLDYKGTLAGDFNGDTLPGGKNIQYPYENIIRFSPQSTVKETPKIGDTISGRYGDRDMMSRINSLNRNSVYGIGSGRYGGFRTGELRNEWMFERQGGGSALYKLCKLICEEEGIDIPTTSRVSGLIDTIISNIDKINDGSLKTLIFNGLLHSVTSDILIDKILGLAKCTGYDYHGTIIVCDDTEILSVLNGTYYLYDNGGYARIPITKEDKLLFKYLPSSYYTCGEHMLLASAITNNRLDIIETLAKRGKSIFDYTYIAKLLLSHKKNKKLVNIVKRYMPTMWFNTGKMTGNHYKYTPYFTIHWNTNEFKVLTDLITLILSDKKYGYKIQHANALYEKIGLCENDFQNIELGKLANIDKLTVGNSLISQVVSNQITKARWGNTTPSKLSGINIDKFDLENRIVLAGLSTSDDREYLLEVLKEYHIKGDIRISETMGSRDECTIYLKDEDWVLCGCFKNTLAKFEIAVNDDYGDVNDGSLSNRVYFEDYTKFIAECRL